MPPQSTTPLFVITSALVAYTIGWSERVQGRLRPWHLAFFWLGLACDTAGTEMMRRMAGGFTFDFHGITGGTALLLSGSSSALRRMSSLVAIDWLQAHPGRLGATPPRDLSPAPNDEGVAGPHGSGGLGTGGDRG